MKKLTYILYIVSIFLVSCEKPFDWNYDNDTPDIPVFEGIITNENVQQHIRISSVRSHPNEPASPVTDAVLNVSVGSNSYAFTHDTAVPGNYKSVVPFIGVVGVPVNLSAVINGITYTATDVMIPVTPTPRATFRLVNLTDSLFEIVQPSGNFSSNEPAMWVIDIDWTHLPAYQNVSPDSCRARLLFFDLKTLDVSQVFAPDKQRNHFPGGALVVQTKYALSNDHAAFWRSVLLETEWRGGLFDVSPGTVVSNIKTNAAGFFGASSVVKTTYVVK